MLSENSIDAAIHISTQITNNRLVDSLNELRGINREHAWDEAWKAAWSSSQQQLEALTNRFAGLVDNYNQLLATYRDGQDQISRLKAEVELQREEIEEGRCHIDTLRELADIYHDEILRLDPASPL